VTWLRATLLLRVHDQEINGNPLQKNGSHVNGIFRGLRFEQQNIADEWSRIERQFGRKGVFEVYPHCREPLGCCMQATGQCKSGLSGTGCPEQFRNATPWIAADAGHVVY